MSCDLENSLVLPRTVYRCDDGVAPEDMPVMCADCGEHDPLDGDDFCAACRVRWDADEDAAYAAWLQNKRKTA